MQIRDWFRPPRHVLAIFLGVALVSGATLAALAWLLLRQDHARETQRRQERIEQAADRAAAVMQRSLADLEIQLAAPLDRKKNPPPDVVLLGSAPDGLTIHPQGALLYYPDSFQRQVPATRIFDEGEQLEFAKHDTAGAIRIYTGLAASQLPVIRAGALNRLARLHRKLHAPDAALAAYDRLARMPASSVEGMPAGVVARLGRASLFEETHRTAELQREAAALDRDLRNGRWRLTKSEYAFHSAQARQWLGHVKAPDDSGLLARAEAASWLWQNRGSHRGVSRRLLEASGKPVLLLWSASTDRLDAVIAGPQYLFSLGREAIPDPDLRWALTDIEGRTVLGALPPTRTAAIRHAATAALPWTLYVFEPPGAAIPGFTSRQRLLLSVFAVLALVLFAGAYFILRAIARELRVARLQSDFVAAVSHEFRSPLSSLCQISEMLAHDRFPTEDLRRKSYGVLERETERLRRLVEGVLDFGRFEAGAYGYRFERIELGALVASIIEAFEAKVSADGYRVDRTGAAIEVYVDADREALSRALWNLLDNAVKYSPECRTVWVDVASQDSSVTVTVRDRGLGIPAHEQRNIFNKFVRGSESKARSIKGTGIGLAMVRQIVRDHGGEIRLASEPGQGSRFTLVLHAAEGLS